MHKFPGETSADPPIIREDWRSRRRFVVFVEGRPRFFSKKRDAKFCALTVHGDPERWMKGPDK